MTLVQTFQFLTFANFLICAAGGFICACRLRHMRFDTTRQSVRWAYSLIVVGLTVNGFWFWFFGTFADWQNIVASVTAVGELLMHSRSWRNGLPDFAKSGPVPLSPANGGSNADR